MSKSRIREGAVYRHYKQGLYRVQAVVLHSETLEEMVVYEALYDNPKSRWWVRPLKMFLEGVERDGELLPRFALCTDDSSDLSGTESAE